MSLYDGLSNEAAKALAEDAEQVLGGLGEAPEGTGAAMNRQGLERHLARLREVIARSAENYDRDVPLPEDDDYGGGDPDLADDIAREIARRWDA